MTDGLTERDRKGILAVLEAFPKIRRAILFGSRAIGTFRGASDLDLALEGEGLKLTDLVAINARISRLELPFDADFVIRAKINNPDLEKHIREYGRVFYERKRTADGVSEWRQQRSFREIRVGDLVSSGDLFVTDGYRMRNVELAPSGIPFVRGGDIGDGTVNTTTEDHIAPKFAERIAKKLSQPGDVAFITKGTVGRVGFLRSGQPQVVFAPQVCCWRALNHEALEPLFLFYLLKSDEFQANLDAVKTHGSMVADYVSITDQMNFRLTIPPIREQRAIASVLGALDDKIELNRRMNETLEAIAKTVFNLWFIVATQSENWREAILSDLMEFVKGKKPAAASQTFEEGFSPIILIETFDTGKSAFASPNGMLEAQSQDVLMAMDGASSGRVETGFEGLVGSTLAKIVPKQEVPGSRFLYYTLKQLEPETREHLTGTSIPHADKGWIIRQTVGLPKDDKLVIRFEEFARLIRSRIDLNRAESHTLAALRDALLPRLLSGELDANGGEVRTERSS